MGVIVVGKSGDTYHHMGAIAADEGLASFDGLTLYGTAGAVFQIVQSTEVIDCAGASDTTSGLVPAGATVLGIDTHVSEAMTTSAKTYSVGDGTDPDRWGANIDGSAIGNGSDGEDYTAGGAIHAAAGTEVTLTYDEAASAGEIRVSATYYDTTKPTS